MSFWGAFRRWWDAPFALLVAATVSLQLAPDCLKSVTGEMITFFGIQSAVILPSMLFTAGLLGPEGLTIEQAQRYHKALGRQMTFWTVLLALDFFAVVSLIAGKALDWKLVVTVPRVGTVYDASWVLLFVVSFLAVLALLRTVPFVRGVRSLHELRGELLQLAIKSRNSQAVAEQQATAQNHPFVAPEGFGNVRSRTE